MVLKVVTPNITKHVVIISGSGTDPASHVQEFTLRKHAWSAESHHLGHSPALPRRPEASEGRSPQASPQSALSARQDAPLQPAKPRPRPGPALLAGSPALRRPAPAQPAPRAPGSHGLVLVSLLLALVSGPSGGGEGAGRAQETLQPGPRGAGRAVRRSRRLVWLMGEVMEAP